MDAKKRIDKILAAVHEQVKEEIGVLLGVEFTLGDASNSLVSKAEFFNQLAGKQVVAKIDLAGEIEGKGCLVIGIKDAIRLGGTLIMLPDSELEEVVGREEYGSETEDSYGEIANIIAGSYTKTFEEMYSKSFRFIRKEQLIVLPAKVEVASDEPAPNQPYYRVSCTMKLEGRQMGELHMLMPAVPFGLQPPDAAVAPQAETEDSPPPQPQPETAAEPGPVDVEQGASPHAESAGRQIPPAAPSTAGKKPVDAQKQKKRIDKLLGLCQQKLSEDISSLLGVEITFSDMVNGLFSKEQLFFEELENKQVIAEMEIVGELQGVGHFFVGLKDAIRLGGILIMLPPTELDNVIADEEFGDDARDAFGEVANIVSGVYTQVFEEQYPQKIRFIKKGLQRVVPMKADIGSDEPMADGSLYISSMQLTADGERLGRVRMVLPAAMFQLDQATVQTVQAADDASAAAADGVSDTSRPEPEVEAAPAAVTSAPRTTGGAKFDQAKHRQRVDKLLKECSRRMKDEVSALLGTEVAFTELENRPVSKEDFFFDVANGKQVISHLDVVGELEDRSYLFVSLKDAIYLGGVLIMLPPTELESVVADEEFSDDTRDAFGEITNIIAGVYTGVFEEQYTDKIRFVRNELGLVVPMKVDVDSDVPVPDIEYYMSSMTLQVEGQARGRIHLLLPAAMLMLDAARAVVPKEEQAASSLAMNGAASPVTADEGGMNRGGGGQHAPADILVICDDEQEYAKLAAVAADRGLGIRKMGFKDNIKGAITQELKAVYIMMREVNEQGFGMAIKVSSSCSLPLVAAGPDWTRSRVIKAVKYGVNDILLTPASVEDIRESLQNNLMQMAA